MTRCPTEYGVALCFYHSSHIQHTETGSFWLVAGCKYTRIGYHSRDANLHAHVSVLVHLGLTLC